MHQTVAYIIESAVIFAVLVGFYKYACYRQTYFKWDRFFLIFFIVMCYVLPFCKLSAIHQDNQPDKNVVIQNITLGQTSHTVTFMREINIKDRIKRVVNSPSFHTLLFIIMAVYIVGAAIKAISVIFSMLKISRLKRCKPEITPDGIKIYTADSRTPAFSFFDNIFVNKMFRNLDSHSQEIILNHERQHIKGCHSIDIVIFTLLSIVQWFNPAVKKAAALSRQVCENIADSHVSKDAKAEYTMLLLKLGQSNSTPTMGGGSGNLKDRVLNIFSYDRTINRKLRFACSLPILLLLIGAYIIIGGSFKSAPKSNCMFPITGGYIVAADYFENRLCVGSNGKQYQISHRETSFYTAKNAVIVCPISGKVASISNNDISITSGDTTVTISNIATVLLKTQLNKGEVIGHAYGGTSALSLKTTINGTAVNPTNIFNY